jgi:phenylpyruvate tautomerase PptA (4-oxalocrotonate tautomerase family)
MPFIHIRSLRFAKPLDISQIIIHISQEFSEKLAIELRHITVTWDYLASGHYAVSGEVASTQPTHSHPVLVEILAPDFNSHETINTMLEVVADSIHRHADIPFDNIFIHYCQAHSEMVFDAGRIVKW